jgi:hypothetical protein
MRLRWKGLEDLQDVFTISFEFRFSVRKDIDGGLNGGITSCDPFSVSFDRFGWCRGSDCDLKLSDVLSLFSVL